MTKEKRSCPRLLASVGTSNLPASGLGQDAAISSVSVRSPGPLAPLAFNAGWGFLNQAEVSRGCASWIATGPEVLPSGLRRSLTQGSASHARPVVIRREGAGRIFSRMVACLTLGCRGIVGAASTWRWSENPHGSALASPGLRPCDWLRELTLVSMKLRVAIGTGDVNGKNFRKITVDKTHGRH
jgi:hypothetical protein